MADERTQLYFWQYYHGNMFQVVKNNRSQIYMMSMFCTCTWTYMCTFTRWALKSTHIAPHMRQSLTSCRSSQQWVLWCKSSSYASIGGLTGLSAAMSVSGLFFVSGFGATRGVTVSMSAFLACHQCYCVGSSLAWGLNLRAVVCGIFWSSSPGVFSGYSGFLPSFNGLMVQSIK